MIRPNDERKPWLTALEARFAQAEPNLSASRQELLRKILDHAEETYFLSSRALAKRYDLDPTTIVRTVQALGYKRYGEFAADLRSHFVTRITPYAVMKSAVRDKRSVANHIEHTLEIDVQNLNALRSQLDVKQVVENCQAHRPGTPHHAVAAPARACAMHPCYRVLSALR
jgi:DNA-binding MurR/RpiR family transcriptional regulator